MKRIIPFDQGKFRDQLYWLKESLQNYMRTLERRKHPRLQQKLQVKLSKARLDLVLEGKSTNLSQGGAFIKFNKWNSFKVHDGAVIAFFLPPEFTGQYETIGLQGDAVVARVDRKNKGIGVEFTKKFKQFEPISVPSD